ncbi:hypothetical protein BDQ17DRAFT_1434903 [Cyathus striatus]|nr:hypothetical protein BDQ17DRAFT_1434903 [Cyathus striatus]
MHMKAAASIKAASPAVGSSHYIFLQSVLTCLPFRKTQESHHLSEKAAVKAKKVPGLSKKAVASANVSSLVSQSMALEISFPTSANTLHPEHTLVAEGALLQSIPLPMPTGTDLLPPPPLLPVISDLKDLPPPPTFVNSIPFQSVQLTSYNFSLSSGAVSTRRSAQLGKSREDQNISLTTSDYPGSPDVVMSPPPPMPTADGDGSSNVNQSDAGGTPERDFGDECNDMYHASETSPMPTVLWSSSSGVSPDNDTPMKDSLSSTPFDNPTGLDAREGDVGVLIFPDGSIGGSVIPSPSDIPDIYSSNGETPEDPSGISEGLSTTEPPIPPSEKISKASFPAASSLEPYIFPCSSKLTPSAQYPSISGMIGGTESLHSHSSRMNNGSSMPLAERVLMLMSKLKVVAPTPQELQNSGGSTVYTHIDPALLSKVGKAPVASIEERQMDLGIDSSSQHLDNHPSSSHLLSKVGEAPVTLTEEPQLDLGIGSPNQHLNMEYEGVTTKK